MKIYKKGKVEVVVFKGEEYKRYPKSTNATDRNYFKRYVCAGVNTYLHRDIYIDTFGEIPEKCDIHHIDWNPLNNEIENLTCLTHKKHKEIHAKESSKIYCENHREEVLDRLKKARPKIEIWQKSEEGKKHFVKMGKISFEKRPFKTYYCSFCGKEYLSKGTKSMYCSAKCCSAASSRKRRASGVSNIERICVICGNTFVTEKYSKTRCCSKKCGSILRYSKNKQVVK